LTFVFANDAQRSALAEIRNQFEGRDPQEILDKKLGVKKGPKHE
jgi:hypothetical protein